MIRCIVCPANGYTKGCLIGEHPNTNSLDCGKSVSEIMFELREQSDGFISLKQDKYFNMACEILK